MVKLNALSARSIPALLSKPGKYTDGRGLVLRVRNDGYVSWVLRFKRGGRSREMGLGPYPEVSLKEARAKAREARQQIRDGSDPIVVRRLKERGEIPTFSEAVDRYHESHKVKWSEGHAKTWKRQLELYATPKLGNIPVDQLTIDDVLSVLEPIWHVKNETASRVRQRIEAILAWGKVRGYRTGDNPAAWGDNLKELLPSPSEVQDGEHFRCLRWEEVPAFITDLRKREGTAARCQEFIVFTACRSGEARGATWCEIDLERKVWTIPGERMKSGREQRVPLSDEVVALLESLSRFEGTDLLFPSPRKLVELSDMAMTQLLKRMEWWERTTTHGFRSSFMVWASEATNYSHDVREMALAHSLGDRTVEAYRRTDLLEKRRAMMKQWAKHCATPPAKCAGAVVSIRQANRFM